MSEHPDILPVATPMHNREPWENPSDPLSMTVFLSRGTRDCLKRHAKAMRRSPDRLLNDLVRKMLEDDLVAAVERAVGIAAARAALAAVGLRDSVFWTSWVVTAGAMMACAAAMAIALCASLGALMSIKSAARLANPSRVNRSPLAPSPRTITSRWTTLSLAKSMRTW